MTDAVDTDAVTAAYERLLEASERGVPCAPVRDLLGGEDIAAAYRVQQRIVEARVAAGARVVGRKIGLTAPVVQAQLGVDRPDFGVLFDDMRVADGGVADSGRLLQPKVEAEIAFVLGADLAEGELDAARMRDAVSYAAAALEIVDSRVRDWDIKITDTVADNASSGLFVLGARRLTLDEFEPAEVAMTLVRDGETASEGTGRACLGDPLVALAWLAGTAREFGAPLRTGDIVLSGALGAMVPVGPGSEVRAELSGLGGVAATFSQVGQS